MSRRFLPHGDARSSLRRFRLPYLEALENRSLLSVSVQLPGLPVAPPLLIQLGSANYSDVASIAAASGVSLENSPVPGVLRARGSTQTLGQFAESLAGTSGLGWVERQAMFHVDLDPNDPYYTSGNLWGLNGANGINAPAAWDLTTGSTSVTVADLDTGIDYDHPDLYENIWINQQEIPASRLANLADVDGDGLITFYDLNTPANQGTGKITDINGDGRIDASDILAPMQTDATGDDTGQGGWADGVSEDGDPAYVDDLVGWNFVANTNDPFDDHGHGTHTAGTIGAMGNNGVGVTGVNWRVLIMPLKFLDSSGYGSDADAAAALRYAADHGARVSSNSYGGGDGGSLMEDAIAYAAARGGVFVAAAGNSGDNTDVDPNYPSAYPDDNIIAVAAMNSGGSLAGFSNYGQTTVDLGAPGVGITSTLPNNRYGSLSGTSMATPHVAGVVGLLLSQHPDWTYSQIIARILDTVTANPSLAGKSVTGGILNAAAAVAVSSSTAAFLSTDTTTQGSWKGVYGTDGYNVINNIASYPSYATVTPSGQFSAIWARTTADVRGLQKARSGETDRIAACWYARSQFSIDVNLTDGQTHEVTLYGLDWDSTTRSETIQVLDADSGAVLDTQTLSSFHDGTYLTWNISGHVIFQFSRTGGANAVISGIFFGGSTDSSSATFLSTDTATQGSWKGVYGADGYNIINNIASYPSYATVTPSRRSSAIWARTTTDVRGLQKARPGETDRIAACWYARSQFSLDVDLTDDQTHKVTLYGLDWDSTARSEMIEVVDALTGAVLDTQTLSSFHDGTYLSWNIRGHVIFRFTRLGGANAVVSGIFFD